MKLKATFQSYLLRFRFEAGTSRGVFTEKKIYFLSVKNLADALVEGVGECNILKDLSFEYVTGGFTNENDFFEYYETQLSSVCLELEQIADAWEKLPEPNTFSEIAGQITGKHFPSLTFALETALLDLYHSGKKLIFDTAFSRGDKAIPINGLVWMGKADFMRHQIDEKIKQGYSTLKMKIGAIDFEQECELLTYIRSQFPPEKLSLRVDANGAFKPTEALQKLEKLAVFNLHSIEQPVAVAAKETLQMLCEQSPVPIALDESLIGIMEKQAKENLLQTIKPQFIILKPALLGGFEQTREWIQIAENQGTAWWITSALESNIGLNAIAQFTATFNNQLPQGLGTGQLYHNNINLPLHIEKGFLWYRKR
ncbi:MAG: o-succinylbenzoate synthase [Verrucomicrobia bacterium]|nr:o-succinylbenzoate synthase [Cytophagales bacterium]